METLGIETLIGALMETLIRDLYRSPYLLSPLILQVYPKPSTLNPKPQTLLGGAGDIVSRL